MISSKRAVFSVGAFRTVEIGDQFMDKRNGCKREGAITCDVASDNLTWCEEILKAAQSDLQMMVFCRW